VNQKKPFLVHGRFQPFHNGHLWLVTEALSRAEHVIIGICTPEICTQEVAEKTGYPCTAEQNPFTHEDRVRMITQSLAEIGVSTDRYSCIPFPSDYAGVTEIIPKDSVFLLSVANKADTHKADYIRTLGFEVETTHIPSVRNESGSFIRASMQRGDSHWQTLVPKAVQRLITQQFEANP
jgi:nicotinamide-nucleotide adenylyltransferase